MVSNLRILDMLVRFMPILRLLSHRNLSKPSARKLTDTRETWELSIAYKKNREKKCLGFPIIRPAAGCQCQCSPRWPRSRGLSETPAPTRMVLIINPPTFKRSNLVPSWGDFPGQAWPQTSLQVLDFWSAINYHFTNMAFGSIVRTTVLVYSTRTKVFVDIFSKF